MNWKFFFCVVVVFVCVVVMVYVEIMLCFGIEVVYLLFESKMLVG